MSDTAKPEVMPIFPEIKGVLGLEPSDPYSSIRPRGEPMKGRYDVGSELSKAARAAALEDRAAQFMRARTDANEFARMAFHDEVPIITPTGGWRTWFQPQPPSKDRNPCGELVGESFQTRMYISSSEMLLYKLKCDPPTRTRSGAWRVGRRRFRTKYLAAKYLSRVSPRTARVRDTLDAIAGLLRDKIISAEEARISALWGDLTPKTIKTTKPNHREWRPEVLSNTSPGTIRVWSDEFIVRRVNYQGEERRTVFGKTGTGIIEDSL